MNFILLWMKYNYLYFLHVSGAYPALQYNGGMVFLRREEIIIRRSNLLLRQLIGAFVFFDRWVAWDGAGAHNPLWQL